MAKISSFLWFDNQAEEAAKFYTSIFKNSDIKFMAKHSEETAKASNLPAGSVLTVNFTLEGQEFTALNGGPLFKFNESISFVVSCKDQEEIDYYWDKLSAVPASEQCGWLKDKYGLSWQIVPENLGELLSSPGAIAVMMKMKKMVIADLKSAGSK